MIPNQQLTDYGQMIAAITKQLTACSQLYNSRSFKGSMFLTGIDCNTGKEFHHIIEIDSNDTELRKYFNDRGATLASKKMLLSHEVQLIRSIEQ